ncbi:MAG: T9SS type A sorting domain-containing protein [Bacteroidales bacterium]|nr:T9SS type A sorting domain-containing protein [Bacteroidales bacterium]
MIKPLPISNRTAVKTFCLLALMFMTAAPVKAQTVTEKFTLTNGSLWWFDGTASTPVWTDHPYNRFSTAADPADLEKDQTSKLMAIAQDSCVLDERGNNTNLYLPGPPANEITQTMKMGSIYLTLEVDMAATIASLKAHGSPVASLGKRDVSAGFLTNCAWYRTGYTGYYYQEWTCTYDPDDDPDNDNDITKVFRSYIIGSSSDVHLFTVEVGERLDETCLWFNWDFGAAMTEVTWRDGVRSETNHWLYYDDAEQAWKMSGNSYERPETEIYCHYHAYHDDVNDVDVDENTANSAAVTTRRFYHGYKDEYNVWHKHGNGAVFMPVVETVYGVELIDDGSNTGLTGISMKRGGVEQDDPSMIYGEELEVQATVARNGSGNVTANLRPSYTTYKEERYRHGINTNYRLRTSETFGSNGITLDNDGNETTRTYYFKNGANIGSAPTANPKVMTVKEVTYSLNPGSRHYVEMQVGTDEPTVHPLTLNTDATPVTLRCYSLPPVDMVATLTVVVKYAFDDAGKEYYTFDTIERTFNLDDYFVRRTDLEPTTSPVVMGYVVGGGRMANVGKDYGGDMVNDIVGGDTYVTIHNADTLYAIYGGNDIAGWVQGTSYLQIGTLQTVNPLRIGYVYGGGCGYYDYSGVYNIKTDSWAANDALQHVVGEGLYCFHGDVYKWKTANLPTGQHAANKVATGFNYTPYDGTDWMHGEKGQTGNGTIPYIRRSHVEIGVAIGSDPGQAPDDATARLHNDLIQIDTVFGGAENAFIGVDATGSSHDAVGIHIHGGSIMAVFGGNNYGGSIAPLAYVNTTVYTTRLAPPVPAWDPDADNDWTINNTYFTGYGRDFGIRHLFGGGNMVYSSVANVTVLGGMIDTCFLGGNRASVLSPTGNIYCVGDNFIYENPYLDVLRPTLRDLSTPNPYYVDVTDASTTDLKWAAALEKFKTQNPGSYDGEKGRYNIRVLFGGNNKAPMERLSNVLLRSGGISYVYGGGNEGDMMGSRTIEEVIVYEDPRDPTSDILLKLQDTVLNDFSGWEWPISHTFSSLVNAPQNSRVIVENLYGGCRKANVEYSAGASLKGGVYGYVQGGCDISGDVGSTHDGEGTWLVIGGKAVVLEDVYGGNDGFYHCHNNKGIYTSDDVVDYNNEPYDFFHEFVGLPAPTQNNSNLYIHGGTVLFSAYGGGVMCDVGFQEGVTYNRYLRNASTGVLQPTEMNPERQKGSIHFMMNGGTVGSAYWHRNAVLLDGMNSPITGSTIDEKKADLQTRRATAATADLLSNHDGNLYGGGFLSSLYGVAYFKIKGDSKVYGSVFAGNDCTGSVRNFAYYTNPAQGIDKDHFLASDNTPLNGAGKADYSSYLLIEGTPRIACVYGGGNGEYTYTGNDKSLEVNCLEYTPDYQPKQLSAFIDLHTSGGFIDTVFGGGNGVGVTDNVHILMNIIGTGGDPLAALAPNLSTNHNSHDNTDLYVGTVFGGNNRDAMSICPDIVLKRGIVGTVYGGGNAGSMSGSRTFTDICNEEVKKVSTYVRLESTDITVTEDIFGGCRMADVANMAYVDIRGTNATGVQNVYGGNDMSGTVSGNTRIDVSGGTVNHIWGGSNGYYQYQTIVPHSDENIYAYNDPTFAGECLAMHTSGAPYVDSTTVNLFGGTITHSVYGGGRMGDCRATYVMVDNEPCSTLRPLSITGEIYGGGEGNYANLLAPRRGNCGENTTGGVTGTSATGSTHVHLKQATSLSGAGGRTVAYGGGQGGDVYNTYVTLYDTWDQPFDAIYGGCWGSDVRGTTTVVLNGITNTTDATVPDANLTAKAVFGGNDFTGNAYKTNVIVNSGTFGNIYGAGNGEKADGTVYSSEYTTSPYGSTADKKLYPPNAEYSHVEFNDGRVTGTVFGGGNQGTNLCYRKTGGVYDLDANGRKIADTLQGPADAYENPNKYSHVIVTVHGGVFDNDIYAGANGTFHGNMLVYGLKELNMDGGSVRHSIYGGSRNVSDGYKHECAHPDEGQVVSAATTQRPSSILNIVGGIISHSVYAGGYLGSIYGSAYVNIGQAAVANSAVWTKEVYGVPGAYAYFKPGQPEGHVAALTTGAYDLTIGQSVYGGANWGDNSGNSDFSANGVFGGETRLFIDGDGYNTGIPGTELLRPMDIGESVIGSGTSASGGDLYNRIDVRNYGAINNDCTPTRDLKSIQRTHALWLNNTAIDYTGSTDAKSADLSTQYSLNHIDTLHTVGYNVININYTVTNIGEVNYWNDHAYPYHEAPALTHVKSRDFVQCYDNQSVEGCNSCDETRDKPICDQLALIDRTTNKYPALVVNEGVNVDFVNEHTGFYSPVYGFAYLVAAPLTNAIVMADAKYSSHGAASEGVEAYGGFTTACSDLMKAIKSTSGAYSQDITWCDCILDATGTATEENNTDCFKNGVYSAEYPYDNYSTQYRVWSLGEGTRRRFAVLEAHSDPTKSAKNKRVTIPVDLNRDGNLEEIDNDSIYHLCVAKSVLKLPPAAPGHYYRIDEFTGINTMDDNGEMNLIDQALAPKLWGLPCETSEYGDTLVDAWNNLGTNVTGRTYQDGDAALTTDDCTLMTGHVESGTPKLANYIYNNPNNFFGLYMNSGENFAVDGSGNLVKPKALTDDHAFDNWQGGTVITGNRNINISGHFATAEVGSTTNASPELDLYMLYCNNFSHTLLGSITFVLNEYESVPKTDGSGNILDASDNIIGTYTSGVINMNSGHTESEIIWEEHDLNRPIEIEITLGTALSEFTDMEYNVLAMYNGGQYHKFSRKVVLPATLQTRELYLQGIQWGPTDNQGNWLTEATEEPDASPAATQFYLTDNSTEITGTNNRFGMTLNVTDNISNTLTSAVGWYDKTLSTATSLYNLAGFSLAGPKRVAGDGAEQANYYTTSSRIDLHKQEITTPALGRLVGILDGRGEAAVNVTLDFDGNQIYQEVGGKGYVGKMVMHLVSYNTVTDPGHLDPNPFKITIFVKTRAAGDTIYLASEPSIELGGSTITSHVSTDPIIGTSGKTPDDYLTSFHDILTGPYQEGDVIAIIGKVTIGANEFIRGEEYMPLPIIRYTGHRHEYPGEKFTYRGTMIEVGNNSSFITRCVTFNGSMTDLTKPDIGTWFGATDEADWKTKHPHLVYNAADPDAYTIENRKKYADTTIAYGPIIAIKGSGVATFQTGTTVTGNYNGSPVGAASEQKGAISVTNGGTLKMINNVTIKNNISEMMSGDNAEHPLNGAVYVDGGKVILDPSNSSTAIKVIQNHQWKNHATAYWTPYQHDGKYINYQYDSTTVRGSAHYGLANVYLTRTEAASDPTNLKDGRTDVISFVSAPAPATRIGIRKWFPGTTPLLRDTIQIAYQSTGTQMSEAVYTNNNFSSDDGYNVFYNYYVNTSRAYLHRCATFNYQQDNGYKVSRRTSSTATAISSIENDRALSYVPLPGATCPTGGDRLIARLQGGFYPYTYTWKALDASSNVTNTTTHVTPYTDALALAELKKSSPNYTVLEKTVADTLLLPPYTIPYASDEGYYRYRVTVDDVTGMCAMTKDVTVKLLKDISGNPITAFVETESDYTTASATDWSDTVRLSDDTRPYTSDHAYGLRTYPAVKVTPYKSPRDEYGSIIAITDVGDRIITVDEAGLQNLKFCEGDLIQLNVTPETGKRFIMWDFSPYYNTPTTYVVPASNSSVIAYFGPTDYWIDAVNTLALANAAYDDNYYYTDRNGKSFVTTHNGDVHIYDEDGLAWFISVVNGLNNTQARPFYFNNVYLHQKTAANSYGAADAYYMGSHLWTPVGTTQHPFRGRFIGVTAGDYSTDASTTPVVIKNIIVNEPNANYSGFFGHIDTATIQSIKLEAALVRGAQYVGAMAAEAVNDAKIDNCKVVGEVENTTSATTILTTHYVSGGMVGNADNVTVDNSETKAKYVGDAVYTGGVIGFGLSSTVTNTTVDNTDRNTSRLQAVYSGGIAGSLDGVSPVSSPTQLRHNSDISPTEVRQKSALDGRSYVLNNYVHYQNSNAQRAGGLVGYAKNTVIENNYVYGTIEGEDTEGGVGAVFDDGTSANHNYYESSSSTKSVGQHRGTASSSQNTTFSGSGNQVLLDDAEYGVNNLTRVLNIWVRTHGENYNTWRSDLDGANHGYPVFGTPDMIPVVDSLTVTGCDSVEWDGITYLFDDEVVNHIVDSVMMVDSTHTLRIVVHHATREQVSDSVDLGDSYSGYGFYLTATEVALLQATMQLHGSATIMLHDTLQSELTGCDSIITLQLTVNRKQGIVEASNEFQLRVYPNPTTSRVTIEASEAMSHVELYDNEGRRLQDYNTRNTETTTIDVSHYPTGAYYLRVHTADNVTIQKLIKK